MSARYPDNVLLDPDEVMRANRVIIGEFYGILPAEVDKMPMSDVDDTLAVLWARKELAYWKNGRG